MKLSTLEAIFRALNDEDVRYIVAGGVAVNAHGHQRMTQDLDLVVALGLRALIAMKEATGRALDRDDARHLRWILEEGEEDDDV